MTSGKPQDVKSAAAELASLFVYQMLAAMRRTVPKSGLLDKGFAHDTYLSLFDQEIARHMARREELGLTTLLQRQLRDADADRQLPGRPDIATASSPLLQLSMRGERRPSTRIVSKLDRRMAGLYCLSRGSTPPVLAYVCIPWTTLSGYTLAWISRPQPAPRYRPLLPGRWSLVARRRGMGMLWSSNIAEGYATLYAHNTANLVSVGTTVSQGQPIATVGSTGRSTGPHLHFEVRKDGKQLDPALFFATGSTPKPAAVLEASSFPK